MEISGRTLKITFVCVAVSFMCCFQLSRAEAGNSWMMERNKQELLMINERLLTQLQGFTKNGTVNVQGKVVIREGKVLLQLDRINQFTRSEHSISDLEEHSVDGEYRIFLREGSLSEIPVIID